ncbi:MAG: 16S rRNA (cytidine(1402)-2'-O)-methyltransferase [Actinomycetota bacterium]|nr:16S rRNA (cytidine(1402)-2'-O)-methyltransferase [Actinomycetota bacterium]MED5276712.1 16S rRNA (cytidine(1402)-2'-O)-methyltransferase [Actinomycetota bacterium]
MSDAKEGVLFLVSTPIGNLSDLSKRAIETLETVDFIACEDTRRTGQLLNLLGLEAKKMIRVDDHTEFKKKSEIVKKIKNGLNVALVSDAGTPGISDPGEELVRTVIENGFKVSVVPGASSVLAALVLSGMSMKRWVMEGFIPRKGKEREEILKELAVEERTIILFESPKRLPETLQDLQKYLGEDRLVSIARELTKLHEEVWRGSLNRAVDYYETSPKGEVVIVIEGSTHETVIPDELIVKILREAKDSGLSARDASNQASKQLNVSRGRAYKLYIDLD